jgi:hypothetical protein
LDTTFCHIRADAFSFPAGAMIPVCSPANQLEQMPEDARKRALIWRLGVMYGRDNAPKIENDADDDRYGSGGCRGGIKVEEEIRQPDKE